MKKFITLLFTLSLSFQALHAQWKEQGFALFPDVQFDWVEVLRVVDEQTLWANLNRFGSFTSEPFVARSTDGGEHWQVIALPPFADGHRPTALTALDANRAWVALRHPSERALSKIIRTEDGGANWEIVLQDSSAGYMMHFFDAQHGLVFRGRNYIQLTDDGGDTWHQPAYVPPANPNAHFYVPGEFFDAVGSTIWFPLVDGTILKSTDMGNHWTLESTPFTSDSTPINMLSFSDENHGIAASVLSVSGSIMDTSRLIHTSDGGLTWAEIPTSQFPVSHDPSLFIHAIEAIPGAPGGTFLLGINNKVPIFNETHEIYITHDSGANWELFSDCPKPGYPLATLEFLSPTVGWGGNGSAFTQDDPFFLKYTGEPYQSRVIFQVDLGDQQPSPQGVHLAMDKDGWNPAANPMTNVGGSVWQTAIPVEPGEPLKYKFINGNAWGQNESVPIGCGVENAAGSLDREYTLPVCRTKQLPAVRFGSCMPGDKLEPQTLTACDPNDNLLLCETFETYPLGALSNQSDWWRSYGCNYDGTEGDSCDLQVTSYWAGFTNYSGGRAMHTVGAGGSGYAELLLGGISSGKHELAMKLFVPTGGATSLFLEIDTAYWTGLPYYQVDFQRDGKLRAWARDYSDYEVQTDYPFDQWMDFRMVFDQDNQQREIWLDGQQLLAVNDPWPMASLNFAAFSGNVEFHPLWSPRSECFVDDIMLRVLVPGSSSAIAQPLDKQRETKQAARSRQPDFRKSPKGMPACDNCPGSLLAQRSNPAAPSVPKENNAVLHLFPNPAHGLVQVRYQLETPLPTILQVIDARGQVLLQQVLPKSAAGIFPLSTVELPQGMYIVRVSDGKTSLTKKLMVLN